MPKRNFNTKYNPNDFVAYTTPYKRPFGSYVLIWGGSAILGLILALGLHIIH